MTPAEREKKEKELLALLELESEIVDVAIEKSEK
jgi:hypothetical protein